MAFKFLAILSIATIASAGLIPVQHHELPADHHPITYHSNQAPQYVQLQKQHVAHEQYPDDPHPQYNFAYDVHDSVSGDTKSQSESRDGDVVQGEYSLNDSDGFRRTVKYTADPIHGFNAVVQREPLTHKVVESHIPAHYHSYAAPTAVVKTPVAYAAPTYSTLPAHYEHHEHHDQPATYTTYEAPQHHESHDHHYHH